MRNLLYIFLTVLLAACGEQKLPSPFKAGDVSAKYAQADFKLNDASGKPVGLADYRGKVVALFFGYTHCPQICPTTLADLAQVMGMLGKDADRVQVLFVTLDPERARANCWHSIRPRSIQHSKACTVIVWRLRRRHRRSA